jgi:hypothetical protein
LTRVLDTVQIAPLRQQTELPSTAALHGLFSEKSAAAARLPFRDRSSRCSTGAKKAFMSTWMIRRIPNCADETTPGIGSTVKDAPEHSGEL